MFPVSILHIENRLGPVNLVRKAVKRIQLANQRPVNYSAFYRPPINDQCIKRAVEKCHPQLAIVDLALTEDGSYDGKDACRCLKRCDPNIKVLLFSVHRGLPPVMLDPRTGQILYDYYLHKFGAIYAPGRKPPFPEDVRSKKDMIEQPFAQGVRILHRAIKMLLDQGVLAPGEWLAPDVRDHIWQKPSFGQPQDTSTG